MTPSNTQSWYAELIKPTWAPDPSLFGKVWSVLYVMIIIAFIYTCIKTFGNPFPNMFGNGASTTPGILDAASPEALWPKYIFYIFTLTLLLMFYSHRYNLYFVIYR